ncbi:hypothetical protein [Pseudofrankia asymbiotica]|uniref:hypothetical protein n=1 Tax=Pseudofrankia asymbiotica TaxID=1834516 RepID=UPI001F52152B|nr:hypothetical protein [Pseudofrankia asymbiotica]
MRLRLPAAAVTVNSLHPATYMPTKIALAEIGRHIDSIDVGVSATHRLIASAEVAGVTGVTGRFFDRTRDTAPNPQAHDREARAELWTRSLELVDRADISA